MVAVRSMGLALESLIGHHSYGRDFCTASPKELRTLVEISNERFRENEKRRLRFRELLKQFSLEGTGKGKKKGQDGEEWEDPFVRRERKKAEGLLRRQQLKDAEESQGLGMGDSSSIDFPGQIA
jgi:tRNA wybutosine-synthesizing protein 3